MPNPSLILNFIIHVHLRSISGHVCISQSLPSFDEHIAEAGPLLFDNVPTKCGSGCILQ